MSEQTQQRHQGQRPAPAITTAAGADPVEALAREIFVQIVRDHPHGVTPAHLATRAFEYADQFHLAAGQRAAQRKLAAGQKKE